MKKTVRSIFLPSYLILLLVTLILIPLQVVSSRAIPFIFIPDQVQPPGSPFNLNNTALFVARGSLPPVPTGVLSQAGSWILSNASIDKTGVKNLNYFRGVSAQNKGQVDQVE